MDWRVHGGGGTSNSVRLEVRADPRATAAVCVNPHRLISKWVREGDDRSHAHRAGAAPSPNGLLAKLTRRTQGEVARAPMRLTPPAMSTHTARIRHARGSNHVRARMGVNARVPSVSMAQLDRSRDVNTALERRASASASAPPRLMSFSDKSML